MGRRARRRRRLVHRYTQDGWASSSIFGISDEGGYLNQTPYDVAQAGGTVIAAGDAGMILVSTDGVNFRHQPASGSQATAGWRAVVEPRERQ